MTILWMNFRFSYEIQYVKNLIVKMVKRPVVFLVEVVRFRRGGYGAGFGSVDRLSL